MADMDDLVTETLEVQGVLADILKELKKIRRV